MIQNGSLAAGSTVKNRLMIRLIQIILFAVGTAIAAQIEIPHQPVPYTLQTFAVLLAGAILGPRAGAASQILYLLMGISGLPVFSEFGYGIHPILGPTGGYLLSFPLAAFTVGYLLAGELSYFRSLVSMLAGLFVIFTLGTIQLHFVYYHDLRASLTNGFLIFSWWDAVKAVSAAGIARVFKFRRHS